MLRSSRPAAAAFPKTQVGRLPHRVFRGLLSVHSHYGLHARRVALRPSAPEASAASLPPQPLRLLLAGATRARREFHPLKTGAFSRRTEFSAPARFVGEQCSVAHPSGDGGERPQMRLGTTGQRAEKQYEARGRRIVPIDLKSSGPCADDDANNLVTSGSCAHTPTALW